MDEPWAVILPVVDQQPVGLTPVQKTCLTERVDERRRFSCPLQRGADLKVPMLPNVTPWGVIRSEVPKHPAHANSLRKRNSKLCGKEPDLR